MSHSKQADRWWSLPALLLWGLLFTAGLFPEQVFLLLRDLGQVTTQRALANSPWLITIAFSVYMGWFTTARCRESGQSDAAAVAKGVQSLLVALTAFMPIGLELLPDYLRIPVPLPRYLVLTVVCAKGIAWTFLAVLIASYYLGGSHRVFVLMPSVFPSSRWEDSPIPKPPAITLPTASEEPVDTARTSVSPHPGSESPEDIEPE